MGEFITSQVVKLMLQNRVQVCGARILILGLTFKENCPDTRNTRVVDIIRELQDYNTTVDVYDPWVKGTEVKDDYQIDMTCELKIHTYDAIIIAVAHDIFRDLGAEKIKALGKPNCIIYDIKSLLSINDVDGRL